MLEAIKLVGTGIVLGIANVIPGVSGGTIAVVFNIYDRLLAVITPNLRKIFAQWKFWLPLALGLVAGILFFAKLVSFLFANYPAPTRCFFVGIIAGSLPLIYRRMRPAQTRVPPFSALVCLAAALVLMVVMFLTKTDETAAALPSAVTPALFVFLFAAGLVAAVAMIIPGISGSFLLLALGAYAMIIAAVSSLVDAGFLLLQGRLGFAGAFDALVTPLLILAPVLLGVIVGLFCGAAIVRVLLRAAPRQTYGAILGLVAGSVLVVFPRGGIQSAFIILISVICFLAGTAVSLLFARKNSA